MVLSMNEHTDMTVAGEQIEDLARALCQMAIRPEPDGMTTFCADWAAEVAAPVLRALLRIEAELMLEEADAHAPGAPLRTSEQRAVDAFVELAQRLMHALQASSPPRTTR